LAIILLFGMLKPSYLVDNPMRKSATEITEVGSANEQQRQLSKSSIRSDIKPNESKDIEEGRAENLSFTQRNSTVERLRAFGHPGFEDEEVLPDSIHEIWFAADFTFFANLGRLLSVVIYTIQFMALGSILAENIYTPFN